MQVLCNSLGGCLSAALASGLVVLPALGDPGIVQLAATGAFLVSVLAASMCAAGPAAAPLAFALRA